MKIFLLALLGLAAGGDVKTISTSSTSDSTVAAPPDSFAPVPASSDTSSTSPTSSPSSIGSIGSIYSSTSSAAAPAGDEIRDIDVMMNFAVEATDGSDEEMFANIKKSVADSLHGALGTDLTMTKITVVENGRRLKDQEIKVTYSVQVKKSFEAAAKHTIDNELNANLAEALAISGTPVKGSITHEDVIVCSEDHKNPEFGMLNCTNKMVPSSSMCPLMCNTNYHLKNQSNRKCGDGGKWEGVVGECAKACGAADEGCRTPDGNEIGKCASAGGACAVDATLCVSGSTDACGAAPLAAKGKCSSGKCIYADEDRPVPLKSNMVFPTSTTTSLSDILSGGNTVFNTKFTAEVLSCVQTIDADAVIADVEIKAIKDPKTTTIADRTELQVYYTVVVKETLEMAAKYAIETTLSKKLIASLNASTPVVAATVITTVTEGVVVCDKSANPTVDNGSIECANKRAFGALSCPLSCNPNFFVDDRSGYKCTSKGVWEDNKGKCTAEACATSSGGCRMQNGIEIGKCGSTVGSVCGAYATACTDGTKCGAAPFADMGTCDSNSKCIFDETHEEQGLRATIDLPHGTPNQDQIARGENEAFNKNFIAQVAAIIGVPSEDVKIKNIKASRRLHGQFLQDAPSRTLQVEYSVRVKPSEAADAKAALDTFMFSSNLT